MKSGSVYKIIDIRTNEVVYVGQHWYDDREGSNDKYMGSGHKLEKIYREEGRENFKKEILIDGINNQNDMNKFEILFIEKYKTVENGYNISIGGHQTSGIKHSEETKVKISKSLEGNTPWNKGQKMSVEFREKMSEIAKNRKPNFKGKKHTEETKKKISESLTGQIRGESALKGCKHTEETKKKISESLKGRESPFKGKESPFKGKKHTEETKNKIRDSLKETKRKISESKKTILREENIPEK